MLQIKVGEVNLLKVFGHFNLILLFFTLTLHAGAFAKFQITTTALLQTFHNQQDKNFQTDLLAPWHEYNSLIKKLPISSTVYKISLNKPIISVGPRILITLRSLKNISFRPSNKYKGNLTFNFFGYLATFNISKKITNTTFYPKDKQGVVNFFNIITHVVTSKLINHIKDIGKKLRLNDWGIFMLTNKLSSHIFKDKNSAHLLTWYLLNKLHFDVKVALSNQQIKLLSYCKNSIFNTPYFLIGHKKYYFLFNKNSQANSHIVTYLKKYPKATKSLNLSLKILPLFPNNKQTKALNFTYLKHRYFLHVNFNKNLTDFMQTYPLTEQKIYLNAPMQSVSYHDLASQLIGYINGKRASRAMNFVLAFTQHAFGVTNKKEISRQYPMFAQQALAYKILGYRARVTLFVYLIKHIFAINVIGVKYKKYLLTALNIPMKGYSFMVNKHYYVVADPSYINANIGQIPSKYMGIKPQKIIQIDQ